MKISEEKIINHEYRIKLITENEINEAFELCKNCADYYLMDTGRLPCKDDVLGIFAELPPQKTLDDKYIVGMFNINDKLVGLMDIVKDYPEKSVWMLGLLLIHTDVRKKGLGKAFYHEVVKLVKNNNGKVVRIGVYEENESALNFWKSIGFREVKRVDIENTNKQVKSVIVMNCSI